MKPDLDYCYYCKAISSIAAAHCMVHMVVKIVSQEPINMQARERLAT